MLINVRPLAATLVLVALVLAPVSNGADIADYNFNSSAIGSTPVTTAPGTDALPQSNLYAIGGFPDSGPFTGTATVQNVGGMSKAVQLTTTQGGTGALYLDTQFLVATNLVSLSFDINILDVPTTGLPQAV